MVTLEGFGFIGNTWNENWIILPPGDRAIFRKPCPEHPDRLKELYPSQKFRMAAPADLLVANLGRPFPWGFSADASQAPRLWKEHRIGVGGLKFTKWFMTTGGRFGGAPNVPDTMPASLRYCLLYNGGGCGGSYPLEENEGYALLCDTSSADREMYRQVQVYAAKHVMADGGAIIVSPVHKGNHVFVGFGGRCQICPNPELISIEALRAAFPEYNFELFPEWKSWSL